MRRPCKFSGPTTLAVYDGRDCVALVKHQPDGWHVVDYQRRQPLGIFKSRSMALSRAYAHKAHTPGSPTAGERERDINHVKQIRSHQRRAKSHRRKASRGKAALTAVSPAVGQPVNTAAEKGNSPRS
jgi:hypothetical protein